MKTTTWILAISMATAACGAPEEQHAQTEDAVLGDVIIGNRGDVGRTVVEPFVGVTEDPPTPVVVTPAIVPVPRNAAATYAAFADATSGEVQLTGSFISVRFPIGSILDTPFNQLVSLPRKLATYDTDGNTAVNFRVIDRPFTDEWYRGDTARGFLVLGVDLSGGTYRRINMSAVIGGERLDYQALEFCFMAEGVCRILDPVIPHLQDTVDNRETTSEPLDHETVLLVAAGGPQVFTHPNVLNNQACVIASDPGRYLIKKGSNWASGRVNYKTLKGQVLVTYNLGAQEAVVACNWNNGVCDATPVGSSAPSSCSAGNSYECDCASQLATYDGGATAKTIAKTECHHIYNQPINVQATIANAGTSALSVNFTGGGSSSVNGGASANGCIAVPYPTSGGGGGGE